jgi:hypothetical protein
MDPVSASADGRAAGPEHSDHPNAGHRDDRRGTGAKRRRAHGLDALRPGLDGAEHLPDTLLRSIYVYRLLKAHVGRSLARRSVSFEEAIAATTA